MQGGGTEGLLGLHLRNTSNRQVCKRNRQVEQRRLTLPCLTENGKRTTLPPASGLDQALQDFSNAWSPNHGVDGSRRCCLTMPAWRHLSVTEGYAGTADPAFELAVADLGAFTEAPSDAMSGR